MAVGWVAILPDRICQPSDLSVDGRPGSSGASVRPNKDHSMAAQGGAEDGVVSAIGVHLNHSPQGPAAWNLCPEVPSGEEILAPPTEIEDLPKNPVGSVWGSKEEYLRTQYTLMRKEGTEGLRYAVNYCRRVPEAQDDADLCVYKRVHVLGYLMSKLGPICRISFSTENAPRRIKWQQSRRLTPGTIVALTTAADQFRSVCKIATVAQRPYRDGLDHTPPRIDVIWADGADAVFDPELELLMVEGRNGYFESVRHTLIGLQLFAKHQSPFDKYLLRGDQKEAAAAFVEAEPVMDLSTVVHRTRSPRFRPDGEKHNLLHGVPQLRGSTSMDESQVAALHRIVTKELAIVQGPPGTGKTFTSLMALMVMVRNRKKTDPPIVVSAQTNHALDQLLSLLLEQGARILRVGGRTESEIIEKHTMFNLRKKFGKLNREATPRALELARLESIDRVQDLAGAVFNENLLDPRALLDAGILTKEQYSSLEDDGMERSTADLEGGSFSVWLGEERIPAEVQRSAAHRDPTGDDAEFHGPLDYEYEGEVRHIADDEEEERIHGTFLPFRFVWTGKDPAHLRRWRARAEVELRKPDLFMIPRGMRGAVYQLLMAKYLAVVQPRFAQLLRRNTRLCKDLTAHRWAKDVQIVRESCVDIVGCTTTGLAKYRGFVAALRPRTLMIEEAAESYEANITAALYPSVRQLILVGDHQQLTPHCAIRWLEAAPFHLTVSLFERMVQLGVPYVTLNTQRRMIPEIRSLLNPFYPDLRDHALVRDAAQRPPVPGMGGLNTWLLTHRWEEQTDANASKYNAQEAQMVVNFFAYLVANGVRPSQITVLTFYNGQRKVLLGKLRRHASIAADSFHVCTVDSYQGEENDIVLLSLVRSPAKDMPYAVGFLEDTNRAVVAISRARRGFYIFGNMDNALRANDASFQLWGRVWNGFAQLGRIRRKAGLPLTCQRHNRRVWVKELEDWGDNAGGCDKRCGQTRSCGHKCKLRCHFIPHERLGCDEACRKILDCGHGCAHMCSEPCRCQVHCRSNETATLGLTHGDGNKATDSHVTRRLPVMTSKELLMLKAEEHLHLPLEEVLAAEVADGSVGIEAEDRKDQISPPPPAPKSAAARFHEFAGNAEQMDRMETARLVPVDDAPPMPQVITQTYKPTALLDGYRVRAGPSTVVHHGPESGQSNGQEQGAQEKMADGEEWLIEL
ncbi:hypothetical protein VTK73DRAFT_7960 [Phialemonium thermophilum]|uniref:Uncharacterized protein n=1 Tax=Phialemonium thermophilum TaxID=223376 RepID=A0ABR3WBF2_9PEZI